MSQGISDGSDSNCSEESSDGSPRGIKRSPETQKYEVSKRGRQDYQTMTIDPNGETMENSDSLFSSQGSFVSSQHSFADDLISSQPESLRKGLPVCKVTSSGKMYTHVFQPPIRADTKGRHMEIQERQAKPNKRITKRCQSEFFSQENNDEHEFSERDKQKALNRKYARDSRNRKNQMMYSLEKAKKKQRCVIQIYRKVITVYYKRLHRGEEPKWRNRNIEWYNSKDGECGECKIVQCLLPIEDDTFYDELGNNTLGQIIEDNSDTEILFSGTVSTRKTISNPVQHLVNISHGTRLSSSVQLGYSQKPPTNVDSRDSRDDRQTRSGNTLPCHTLVSEKPEVYENFGRSELNSLHEASSHTLMLSHGEMVISHSQQANSDISCATKSAKNIGIATATHPVIATRSFNGDSYMRATQTSFKPCSVVAPVNSPLDIRGLSILSAPKYVASRGNDPNIAKHVYWDYIKQLEHEEAFRNEPGDQLMPSLSQPVVLDSLNETDELADLQRVSSVENLQEDILDVEDLQSSLETADPS